MASDARPGGLGENRGDTGCLGSDGEGVYTARAGQRVRGREGDLPNTPPVAELCRSLQRGSPMGAVEALAFPVRARE